MDTLARKIIDAIQNSLVGGLAIHLLWISYLGTSLIDEIAEPEWGLTLKSSYFALFLFGSILVWLIGAIAKSAPRPTTAQHLSDRVTRPPENGFESWSQQPANGLHPPLFIRRIVMAIGGETQPPRQKFGLLALLLFIGLSLFAFGVVFLPNVWPDAHPLLKSVTTRVFLVLVWMAIIIALVIRGWATKQKFRLATQDQPSVSTAMSPV